MLFPAKQMNLPERPTESLFGDNPSGRAFGRMGQTYMGRANPFGKLVTGLTADEFLLLREAVDERRCRDEVGVGTLAEAAAACRPRPRVLGVRRARRMEGRVDNGRGPEVALPLLRQEVQVPHGHRPRALPQAASRLGLLHQAHAPQRPRRVRGRAVRRHPQDGLRAAAPRARHGIRLPGPDRAVRHRLSGRDLHQRYRPLQGLRAGAQARANPPEVVHLRGDRRAQEPCRGRH